MRWHPISLRNLRYFVFKARERSKFKCEVKTPKFLGLPMQHVEKEFFTD
jgi:hypothetical protein